jgi:hypothetical protein
VGRSNVNHKGSSRKVQEKVLGFCTTIVISYEKKKATRTLIK